MEREPRISLKSATIRKPNTMRQSTSMPDLLRRSRPLFVLALTVAAFATPPHQAPVTIPAVHHGKAVLSQNGRVTTLTFTPTLGKEVQIPLTHESDYPQGYNGPIKARLIVESSGQYLVFTDTFASNPGNPQGECGASPGGERYLHVVSLAQAKETFSTLIESCRQDIEAKSTSPEWDAVKHTLTVRFTKYDSHSPRDTYQIDPGGSVQLIKTP